MFISIESRMCCYRCKFMRFVQSNRVFSFLRNYFLIIIRKLIVNSIFPIISCSLLAVFIICPSIYNVTINIILSPQIPPIPIFCCIYSKNPSTFRACHRCRTWFIIIVHYINIHPFTTIRTVHTPIIDHIIAKIYIITITFSILTYLSS